VFFDGPPPAMLRKPISTKEQSKKGSEKNAADLLADVPMKVQCVIELEETFMILHGLIKRGQPFRRLTDGIVDLIQ